jgi:uncharacterized protein YkwD
VKAARRTIALSVAVLMAVVSPSTAASSPAKGHRARATNIKGSWPEHAVREEAAFVADINALRASRGLPALELSAELVRKARRWAATMAAARRIWHSGISVGISSHWRKLGENVGMGGSQPSLHAAFVASPRHLENLVDPAFRHVGIGVVHARNLRFVSQVFMQRAWMARRATIQTLRRLPPQDIPPIRPPSTSGKPRLAFRPVL